MCIIPTLKDLLNIEHIVSTRGVNILPNQPVQSLLAGKHKSKLRGRGLDFEESRKYVPGDDIRNIDWRVTARTGTTHTKVFKEEKEKPCFVITDLTPSMFFGSQVYTKAFIACQLAAISAYKILHNGDRFGGLILDNESDVIFSPKRNRTSILPYFEQLVEQVERLAKGESRLKSENEALTRALIKTQGVASHDYLIIVISDFNRVPPELKHHLVQLSMRNDLVLAKINDPLEQVLPDDKMVLSDGELQILWEAEKKGAKKSFDSKMSENHISFIDEMKRYGIPTLLLETITPIEEQIVSSFNKKK